MAAHIDPPLIAATLGRVRRGLAVLVALALLAVGLLVAQQSAPAPAAAAPRATTASTTSGGHPYGNPEWFPLRRPADIGCARTACGRYKAHGYWAIDWIGRKGDPIYAAGAGVLHVGGRASGCSTKGGDRVEGGTWVWIDHGAGVVSRYHHLDSITARDGQLVTPATKIGTVGSSGDHAPCIINYLHFEVRHGGLKGKRVDFGQLKACTAQGLRTLPAVWGAKSWDDPAIHTRPRIKTPGLGTGCVDPGWLRTPAKPTMTAVGGSRALTVRWNTPAAGTRAVVVAFEIYRPSLGRYAGAQYVTVPATARSYRFANLENGRKYRVSIQLRGAAGHSAASAKRTVVPAGVPLAPRSPRYAQWTKRDYVHYGWYRAKNNGAVVSSYTVAYRCGTTGKGYGAWRLHRHGTKDVYWNIRGMKAKKYTACQVKTRGANSRGQGAWSATTTIRWRG